MPSGSQHSIVERDSAVKRRCAERELAETPGKLKMAFFPFRRKAEKKAGQENSQEK